MNYPRKIHELKAWPQPFDAVESRAKRHEYRRNDRDFRIGDWLHLRRFDPEKNEYTGASLVVEVTYITNAETWADFKPVDHCILSIRILSDR